MSLKHKEEKAMLIRLITLSGLLVMGAFAHATPEVKEVVVRTGPNLYLNAEFGLGYTNTGALPAKLELRCGTADSNETQACGSIDVHLAMKSYGPLAYVLDYTRKNPLVIKLYVNAKDALIADVLGNYMGGRAGGGVGLVGGRGMILVNTSSGVWGSTGQNFALLKGRDDPNFGFDLGIDVSIPNIDIRYDGKIDISQPLTSLISI
jgi:hypothetical protein